MRWFARTSPAATECRPVTIDAIPPTSAPTTAPVAKFARSQVKPQRGMASAMSVMGSIARNP